jgi:hypothetical protein
MRRGEALRSALRPNTNAGVGMHGQTMAPAPSCGCGNAAADAGSVPTPTRRRDPAPGSVCAGSSRLHTGAARVYLTWASGPIRSSSARAHHTRLQEGHLTREPRWPSPSSNEVGREP